MMQMKKTCIKKNIALDDVDEKNMYYEKTLHLMMYEKTCIKKTPHLKMQKKSIY